MMTGMATWRDVEADAPEFATAVRALFDAHRHKVLATLRADGSPRVSGIEVEFRDGEIWLGMMGGSRKVADLRRDPRLAVHSASEDPPDGDPGAWPGDAKVAGRAVEVSAVEVSAVDAAAAPERGDSTRPDGSGNPDVGGNLGAGAEPGDSAEEGTEADGHRFRIEIREVVRTRIGEPADHLVIEFWREGEGMRSVRRY